MTYSKRYSDIVSLSCAPVFRMKSQRLCWWGPHPVLLALTIFIIIQLLYPCHSFKHSNRWNHP